MKLFLNDTKLYIKLKNSLYTPMEMTHKQVVPCFLYHGIYIDDDGLNQKFMDALSRIDALTKLLNDKDRDIALQGDEIDQLL